jgi:hypothetical protein
MLPRSRRSCIDDEESTRIAQNAVRLGATLINTTCFISHSVFFDRQRYQVVFYDSENDFDDNGDGGSFLMSIDNDKLREFQQLKKQSTVVNDTRQPKPGDSLYVLGSNESIFVGTITSVAQPNDKTSRFYTKKHQRSKLGDAKVVGYSGQR